MRAQNRGRRPTGDDRLASEDRASLAVGTGAGVAVRGGELGGDLGLGARHPAGCGGEGEAAHGSCNLGHVGGTPGAGGGPERRATSRQMKNRGRREGGSVMAREFRRFLFLQVHKRAAPSSPHISQHNTQKWHSRKMQGTCSMMRCSSSGGEPWLCR